MEIPLKQFEQYIDEVILKRGLTYFKNGHVNEPEEITPGKYEVVVEGTEDYTVQVQIENDTITDYLCTCPYDFGPVCKHLAAVIFYLQQEVLDLQTVIGNRKSGNQNTARKGTRKKRKTVAAQVNELLNDIPHHELKAFLREKAANNTSFRNALLSSFAHLNKNETQATYNKQIRSILRKAAGRYGFIDWTGVRQVGNTVHSLVVTARNHFEGNNYQSALFICCAVLEEMTEALQFTDDSNGDIGGPIEEASQLLSEMASMELPEKLRKNFLSYCLKTYNSNKFSGWDWHLGILDIASTLIQNEQEAEKVIELLDNARISQYEEDYAKEIKLHILRKIKGEKEAEKFMALNLSNPSIRKAALEKACSNIDYEKAIRIAKEGIAHDQKDKPGLVYDWYDWLLKVAIKQKDTEQIIQYARMLFIDSNHDTTEYYRLMKAHVAGNKWRDFVEKLVGDVKQKGRWTNFYPIAKIYISEEWWDQLLAWVQQGTLTLEGIQEYEMYLSKHYPNELARLYKKNIEEYLKINMGRKYYKNACRYMRRMRKLGAKELVNQMIEKFRKEYVKRRALMEELESV